MALFCGVRVVIQILSAQLRDSIVGLLGLFLIYLKIWHLVKYKTLQIGSQSDYITKWKVLNYFIRQIIFFQTAFLRTSSERKKVLTHYVGRM